MANNNDLSKSIYEGKIFNYYYIFRMTYIHILFWCYHLTIRIVYFIFLTRDCV